MSNGDEVSDKELSLVRLDQLAPGNGYNNLTVAVQASVRIRWWPLQKALDLLLRREQALRTVYSVDGRSVRKRVLGEDEAQVKVEHFAATGTELSARLDAYAGAPFALRGDLLVRVGLFHCDDGDVVCLVAHHLVFDAASAYTLLDALVALYNHFCHQSVPPPGLAGPAEVVQERGPTGESRAYWRQHLAGADPASARIACGRPDPADPTLAGAVLDHPLPAEAYQAVRELRRTLRATDSVIFMAAYYALLARHGAGSDLVIGVPLDIRPTGSDTSIGYHANTIALRAQVEPGASFASLVTAVRNGYLAGVAHADVTVDSLAGVFRSGPENWRTHAFRYLFNYLPRRVDDNLLVGGAPARIRTVFTGYSRFDVEFFVLVGPQHASLRLIYNREVHDRADVEALAERYAALLGSAGATPQAAVGDLPMVTDRDRRAMADPERGGAAAGSATLVEVVAAHVRSTPDTPAFRSPAGPLSYRHLWSWVNAVAERIRSEGVRAGEPVGLPPGDPATRVAAMLGAWLAGAVPFPLDACDGPAARVLAGAGGRLVLLPPEAPGPVGASLRAVTLPRPSAVEPASVEPAPVEPASAFEPEGAALLVHRPGPAGGQAQYEAVPHRLLLTTVLDLAKRLGISAGCTVAASTAPGTDALVAEVLVPLAAGGCAVSAGTDGSDAGAVLDALAEHDIRVAHLRPVTARLVASLAGNRLAGRTLLCSGTDVPPRVVDRLVRGGATVFRAYGDPVTGLWLAGDRVRPGETCPGWVGSPLGDERVYVADRRGAPLPPGLPGELRVAGAGALVRTGQAALLRWDGDVQLVPEAVALPHVEAALEAHARVLAAAVARTGDADVDRVVAVVQSAGPITADHLLGCLGDREVMPVPDTLSVGPLPAGPDGAVDYAAILAVRDESAPVGRPAGRAPDGELLTDMVALWQQVLDQPELDADTDFFTVGGQSLLAVRLLQRAGRQLGFRIPLDALLDAPTPRTFTERLLVLAQARQAV